MLHGPYSIKFFKQVLCDFITLLFIRFYKLFISDKQISLETQMCSYKHNQITRTFYTH